MSDNKRRGRGLPTDDGQPPHRRPGEVINESGELDLPPEPTRWRIAISATVFEGYFFGTWEEAMLLQDRLKERKDVTGGVFLRAEQSHQPNDYLSVDDAIRSIEMAVPVKK